MRLGVGNDRVGNDLPYTPVLIESSTRVLCPASAVDESIASGYVSGGLLIVGEIPGHPVIGEITVGSGVHVR